MSEKIHKILADLGHGSRRYIEKIIKLGNVIINEKKVMIGQRIKKNNIKKILINGKFIDINTEQIPIQVLVYNKPEGEICTRKDNKNRPTVFDHLPALKKSRWISIGRLDFNTRGLLLFTNDGKLANNLMHPKNQIEREYYIRIFGIVNIDIIKMLKKGILIQGIKYIFQDIKILNKFTKGKNIWLKVILCEGKNREIRTVFKFINCQVSRLIRIRYGNVILPKDLQLRNWIKLDPMLSKKLFSLILHKY